MARLLLFASIREAAGTKTAEVEGGTVGAVLDAAAERFGSDFQRLLSYCSVLVGDEPAERDTPLMAGDEVAVLPPVSGGQ